MTPNPIETEISQLEANLKEMKIKLAELRKKSPHEVKDYSFTAWNGEQIKLSQLFHGKDDLILIHNMGKQCPYCTVWADGMNGFVPYLEDRASFVLVSNDPIEVQKAFAASRGWKFKMCSSNNTPFFQEMGFTDAKDGSPWPGVSTFRKEKDGKILRIAKAYFGPHDGFCGLWSLFDLLKDGVGDWNPKYQY